MSTAVMNVQIKPVESLEKPVDPQDPQNSQETKREAAAYQNQQNQQKQLTENYPRRNSLSSQIRAFSKRVVEQIKSAALVDLRRGHYPDLMSHSRFSSRKLRRQRSLLRNAQIAQDLFVPLYEPLEPNYSAGVVLNTSAADPVRLEQPNRQRGKPRCQSGHSGEKNGPKDQVLGHLRPQDLDSDDPKVQDLCNDDPKAQDLDNNGSRPQDLNDQQQACPVAQPQRGAGPPTPNKNLSIHIIDHHHLNRSHQASMPEKSRENGDLVEAKRSVSTDDTIKVDEEVEHAAEHSAAITSTASNTTTRTTTNSTSEETEQEEFEEEEERINPAYRAWKKRRREWTKGQDKTTTVEEFQQWKENGPLRSVPEEAYTNVYKMLVKDCRQLKEPMNLADAVRVMKVGWQADGTWPAE